MRIKGLLAGLLILVTAGLGWGQLKPSAGKTTVPFLGFIGPYASAPSVEGYVRYNTSTHAVEFYNGSAWTATGGGSGLPSGGNVGDFVINTGSGTGSWQASPDVPKYVTYTATATANDVVYMVSAGTAARAKADSVNTVYAIGFATQTTTGAACIIQTAGVKTIAGKTFTKGLPVFISATTGGDVTQTAPSTVGQQVQMVGIAVSATDVQIMIGPVGTVGNPAVTTDVFTGTGDLMTTSAANTPDRIAAPAVGQVLISQGVNTKPIWSATVAATTFTGALTGTASGNLVSGGALGTPSSGTLSSCSGLPVSGITASTSTALGVGSIELGHASDTTIARSGAGAITVEGVQVLLSGAALGTPASGVLTGCTGAPLISPKAGSMSSGTASVYPGSDGSNTGTRVHNFELTISGNSQTMTFQAPQGTPTAGDTLFVSIYTTGSSNAVDFTTSTAYRVVGVTSPTTITASKLTIIGFKYNGGLSKWIMIATGQEA